MIRIKKMSSKIQIYVNKKISKINYKVKVYQCKKIN